jgi:excisionase family DNA binding protein
MELKRSKFIQESQKLLNSCLLVFGCHKQLLVGMEIIMDGMRMTEDRWLSVEEIAQYLGVSKETIYRWLEAKTIPCHRIGKLWKFKALEVDKWVVSGDAAASRKKKTKTRGKNGK